MSQSDSSHQPADAPRRRVPRRAVNFNIGILVNGVYHVTRAYEIGEGGMLVGFKEPLEKGQRVLLSYNLAGMMQEVVRGEVRFISSEDCELGGKKYGIQFHHVDFEVKRIIRNFVAASTAELRRTKAS